MATKREATLRKSHDHHFADGKLVVAAGQKKLVPQYDFGNPSTFSAMKLRMSCGLIGAMRGIRDSRK
jgi:hypothetical protein